tara:strand:+ start:161 stop:499 length:339 start_codon:yes stop_codon:yes gene_type:complete
MDLKTGRAKNTSFWGMMKQVIERLTALCCNTQAAIRPSEVLYLSGVVAHTGLTGYYAIQAITDCTFTVLTVDNLAPGSDADLDTKTLTAGHIWYLDITEITLAGGECLIYKV